MAIKTIDELNMKSEPPEDYFGEMDLTKSQIKERISFTGKTYDAILDAMYLIDSYKDHGHIDYAGIKTKLGDELAIIIAQFILLDDYLRTYLYDFAENFVDATQKNIENPWYLSEDRALFNAENSANDTLNYKEYVRAIENGKTHKKWISMKDNKVRMTHMDVDNRTIPIMDYFVVGEALMRFPKDHELASDYPQEIISCRCSIKYLDKY